MGNDLPGFHRKEEHRERTNSQVSKICPKYVDKIQEEMRKYMKGKDDSKVFDFVFEKLKEYIDEFGFEEAKDFVMMYAQSIIPRGMIKEAPIPINLVKEDEDNCEVLCVYKYGDNSYLLRGGQSSINLPIGKISVEEIETINSEGFVPRKLNDAKYIEEIMQRNDKQSAEQRKNTFLASRKINTPICIEAGKQTTKDQRTIEQQNEGHNNYGE